MRTAPSTVQGFDCYALSISGPGVVRNVVAGEVVEGGSTLTQQYVKNALLQAANGSKAAQDAARELSIERKMKEARYALAIERTMSKDEILERYLNIAYYGDGAYGIDAAARHWFSTSAGALTTSQAALLAGIVKNPSYYDPKRSPERATQRRNTVLAVMAVVMADEPLPFRLGYQAPMVFISLALTYICMTAALSTGMLCVKAPIHRTRAVQSGGNPPPLFKLDAFAGFAAAGEKPEKKEGEKKECCGCSDCKECKAGNCCCAADKPAGVTYVSPLQIQSIRVARPLETGVACAGTW